MANETYLPVMGRLTADPELRFTPSGTGVAKFTVAVTARKFNRQSNEWEDKPTRFWDCIAWNQGKLALAENVAEGLKKGDKVIVYGELEPRNYETRQGEKRSVVEIRVESVGKDLRFHQPRQQPPETQQHQTGAYGVPQANQQPQGGGWGTLQQGQQPPQQQQQPQSGSGWNAPPPNDPWSQNATPNGDGWQGQ